MMMRETVCLLVGKRGSTRSCFRTCVASVAYPYGVLCKKVRAAATRSRVMWWLPIIGEQRFRAADPATAGG
jgi:hypothetical protein